MLSLMVIGFALTRLLGQGEVIQPVRVEDVELKGMDRDRAIAALEDLEARLAVEPAQFSIENTPVSMSGEQVGLTIDEQALVDKTMALGREGNVSAQFRSWLSTLFRPRPLDPQIEVDDTLLAELIATWNADVIADPPFEGGLAVDAGVIKPAYPNSGREIDPVEGPRLIIETLSTLNRSTVALPVVIASPVITDQDVDQAVAEALAWTRAPITLVDGDVRIQVTPTELLGAIRSEVVSDPEPGLRLFFAEEEVAVILERLRPSIERPPVDASFEFDGYDVSIREGRSGTLIDPATTAAALAEAVSKPGRTGTLPVAKGAEPEVTTADLEALNVKHLVVAFTTYHDCCQNRVNNIHLIADEVDGTIVKPGETLDLNELVGQRTTEDGYLEDGTIEQGEIIKTVGGGVSQFATTFYNAVFWGGYEDVTHKPHSFYFSRYPEGIEATISWPAPDLAFRNDSESAILIKTEYTDTSITVKFYGDNDGRVVIGSHRSGDTDIDVVVEGGAGARKVGFERSGRYSPTEPTTRYRANPALAPDEQKKIQSGAPGWSISVKRLIEVAGVVTEQEWVVRYLAKPEIIEVHPCAMPDATETCPTTTTVTDTTPSTIG